MINNEVAKKIIIPCKIKCEEPKIAGEFGDLLVMNSGLAIRMDDAVTLLREYGIETTRHKLKVKIDKDIVHIFYIGTNRFIFTRSLQNLIGVPFEDTYDNKNQSYKDEFLKNLILSLKSDCKKKNCKYLNTRSASVTCISNALDLDPGVINRILDNFKSPMYKHIISDYHICGNPTKFFNLDMFWKLTKDYLGDDEK